MRPTLRSLALSLIVALFAAGCAASRNPAAPIGEAVEEPALVGDWVALDPAADWPYLHFLKSGDDPVFELVATGRQSWAVLKGHLSKAGDRTIANLRVVAVPEDAAEDIAADPNVSDRPWSFVAVRFDGADRISFHYLRALLHDAVADGALGGVTDGDYDVYLDASPAEITAFLAGAPEEAVWADPLVYRRLPPLKEDDE